MKMEPASIPLAFLALAGCAVRHAAEPGDQPHVDRMACGEDRRRMGTSRQPNMKPE